MTFLHVSVLQRLQAISWKIEVTRKVQKYRDIYWMKGIKYIPSYYPRDSDQIMNAGQILVFLIGSYASFAIAVMAAAPILA